MLFKRKSKQPDLVSTFDIQFENEVIWGIKNLDNEPFTYYLCYGKKIDWNKKTKEDIPKQKVFEQKELEKSEERIEVKEDVKEDVKEEALVEKVETKGQEEVESQAEKEIETESESTLFVEPLEEEKEKSESIEKIEKKEKKIIEKEYKAKGRDEIDSAPLDLLRMQFLQEDLIDSEVIFPEGSLYSRSANKDMENEAHEKMIREMRKDTLEDKRLSVAYNLKDFPLAEPKLVNELCEAHKTYFDLLTKLQETHTPTDFKTAYDIQDRISYLIDNQTLLYRSLVKELIKYLNKINERLKKYYEKIIVKQEDLRKINAQIARFNEYDRKTHDRLNFVEKETDYLLNEQVKTYENSINKNDLDQEVKKS